MSVATLDHGAHSRIWKLPTYLSDGSKVRALLDVTLRPRVLLEDGSYDVGTNSPDEYPPVGGALLTLSDGSTEVVAYEEDQWSMDLTTLARVKAQSGAFTTTTHDAFLSSTITAASARAEKYMSRTVLRATQTVVVPVERFSSVLFLESLPVDSITSVKYASHPSEFATATALDATSYVLEDTAAGVLRLQIETPYVDPRRPGYVQVVYVGGMADDTTDFVATYPSIAAAIDQQVIYEFQRRHSAGGNISGDAGTSSFNGDLDWLPSVRGVLEAHRRVII